MSALSPLLAQLESDRTARLRHLASPDLPAVREALQRRVVDRQELAAAVQRGIGFASALAYHHPGQDAQTYLAHPMRVTTLYLDFAAPASPEGVVLALVHNVLEVATVSEDQVTRELGRALYDALVVLTVDRALQWDGAYKQGYYERIASAPDVVGAIKVLDKLDNLYTLPLNPDDDVRARYLEEIERWVVPLAEARVPAVVPLIHALVSSNRELGHRPLQSWNLE